MNTKIAYVHLVNNDVFPVTPGIFKLYTKETIGYGDNDWQQTQKDFQALSQHSRGPKGMNVWTCGVKAPGSKTPP